MEKEVLYFDKRTWKFVHCKNPMKPNENRYVKYIISDSKKDYEIHHIQELKNGGYIYLKFEYDPADPCIDDLREEAFRKIGIYDYDEDPYKYYTTEKGISRKSFEFMKSVIK